MPKSFRELLAFQLAVDLVADVYEITERFPRREMYGLTSQVRRAAIGVMSNIAEGQGRLTYGEWRQMLSHARGSLFEVEAQFIAAARLRFVEEIDRERVERQIRRTGKALLGLIRYVKNEEQTRRSQPRNPAT